MPGFLHLWEVIMFDVLIIGGGVSGCCIARELSKTHRKIGLLEAQPDICEGTSKANSGIAHAGFDAKPGTLMAKLNVRGNELLDELAVKLDIPLKRNGALVLCFEEEGLPKLQELYDRGVANGVEGLLLLSGEEARETLRNRLPLWINHCNGGECSGKWCGILSGI